MYIYIYKYIYLYDLECLHYLSLLMVQIIWEHPENGPFHSGSYNDRSPKVDLFSDPVRGRVGASI